MRISWVVLLDADGNEISERTPGLVIHVGRHTEAKVLGGGDGDTLLITTPLRNVLLPSDHLTLDYHVTI